MTPGEAQLAFQRFALAWQDRLVQAAEAVAQDMVIHAKAKLGEYQPAVAAPFGAGGEYFPEWEPLAESTLEEKARLGYGVPDPLLREFNLRVSIFGWAERTGTASATSWLASDSEYAPVQELGRLDGTIPPRPFLGPTPFERIAIYEHFIGLQAQVGLVAVAEHVSGQAGSRPLGADEMESIERVMSWYK